MNSSDLENFYRLFREHDELRGSSNTTLLSLDALMQSIRRVKCAAGEVTEQLELLFSLIKVGEPRIIPLIHLIEEFEEQMAGAKEADAAAFRDEILRILNGLKAKYQSSLRATAERGMECVAQNDVIILHSPSSVVLNSLVKARKEQGKVFRVLILKHDFSKTRQLVRTLSEARIGYLIIPEYDLSPYVRTVTKLFVGAMSVTLDKLVVAAAGTSNVVSFCHCNHIPVYLFVNRYKFSQQPFARQHIHEELESMSEGDFSFRLTTHSHDTVPLELIDHVITDRGEVPHQLGDGAA